MRRRSQLLSLLTCLSVGAGCAGSESLYDDGDVYAAALTEADGEADLDGVPGAEAAPSDGDVRPDREARALHFRCELPAVEARVQDRCEREGGPGAHMAPPEGRGERGQVGTSTAGPRRGRGHRGPKPLSMRRMMWVYDVDGDGELSEAERAALESDLAARCANLQAELLADFDADGDGELSEAELDAARADREAARDAREASILAEFDTDGDGELSPEERRAAHDARRAALVAAYDADGSGDLDAVEEASLRDYLRQVVRGEAAPV